MILVGSNLKKIRLSKKINLINICNDLKISRTLLKQIENDDFQKGISIVYLIGHIRAYANYLDLDSDEVIKRFKEQTSFIDYKPLKNSYDKDYRVDHSTISGIYKFWLELNKILQN